MYWLPDRTGRFNQRPHYRADELDDECERIVTSFLTRQYGKVAFPISTDDLTVLVETRTGSLDLYADLSGEGSGVEGVTSFHKGRAPDVWIASELSVDERRVNRLRTTLTHEFGHVVFHDPLYQEKLASGDLFASSHSEKIVCFRDKMIDAKESDWLEWQACYVSGSLLMPRSALRSLVESFVRKRGVADGIVAGSDVADALIVEIMEAFGTSREAAKVRLMKLGIVSKQVSPSLFGSEPRYSP